VGVMGIAAGARELGRWRVFAWRGHDGALDPIDGRSADAKFQARSLRGQSGKIQPTKESPPAFWRVGNLDPAGYSEGLVGVYCCSNGGGGVGGLPVVREEGMGLAAGRRTAAGEWWPCS